MEQYIEFALKYWYLFLALFVILGLLIGNEVLRLLRGITAVNPTRALQLMNHENAVVLDIGREGEYKQGHIPDARHIPQDALKKRLKELDKLKNRPIIVYGRSGSNPASACALLKKSGFETVHSLSGGLNAWQDANLPISKK